MVPRVVRAVPAWLWLLGGADALDWLWGTPVYRAHLPGMAERNAEMAAVIERTFLDVTNRTGDLPANDQFFFWQRDMDGAFFFRGCPPTCQLPYSRQGH